MNIRTLLFVLATIPAVGVAQLTPTGPFTGAMQDGYETQPRGLNQPSYDIFGGTGSVDQVGGGFGLHITPMWAFYSVILPHGGGYFMGGNASNYQFMFDEPASRFGGYFATNADSPGAVATFYDASNVQIGGPLAIAAPMGDWQWSGWHYPGGIKRIEVIANNQWGGFIMSDDIEYNPVPEPGAIIAVSVGLGLLLVRFRR